MATLDDSPSLFSGQQWSDWADSVQPDYGIESKESDDDEEKTDTNQSMKLRKEDMPLYGVCPSQDEFYLVVCDKCNKVLKPQAFQTHLDLRHGGKGSFTSSASLTRSSSNSTFFSSRCASSTSPTKSLQGPAPHRTGLSVPTKASVKEPPPSFSAVKVGADNDKPHKDSGKGKKNHTILPVVKVERMAMPETLAMKKQLPQSHFDEESSPSSPSLTNGAVKSEESSPVPELLDSIMPTRTQPCVTPPPPILASPVAQASPSPPFTASTVCVKTEPVSAKLIISPTSIAMATSTGTLTTTTVTTSSITSATVTTSVTSTTSSVTLNIGSNGNSNNNAVLGSGNFLLSGVGLGLSSASGVSATVSSVSSTSSSNTSNTAASAAKKYPLLVKPDKIIPLKDREFDPNKHCGVIIPDTGKACTRSLTCKSHALSLRRAVRGRRLPFDELLKEHREAKEAFQKAKAESREAAAAAAGKTSSTSPITSPLSKPHLLANLVGIKERTPLSLPSPPPSKPVPVQKTASPVPSRNTYKKDLNKQDSRPPLSKLRIPSPSLRDEIGSPVLEKPGDKLLIDELDEPPDKDDSYTTHQPKPAATCAFGARYHNFGSGLGCHTFGRKTDYLRAAFLDLLERHLHPPPPKKLCVESKLPKEVHTITNSKDPYDFDIVDSTLSHNRANRQTAVLNQIPNANNKGMLKPKVKPPSSVTSANRTKSRENSSGSKSPGSGGSVCTAAASSAKKRRNSGGSGLVSTPNTLSGITAAAPTAVPAPATIVSGISANSAVSVPSFAIAIPSVNLSAANISHINTTAKPSKNNVGFVVSGISPDHAILNGQYVNITGTQLSDLGTTQIALEDKPLQQTHVIGSNNKTVTSAKFINNLDALRAIHKNNMITVPPNALLLEGMQPGTVLAPVLTTAQANPVVSIGQTAFSPHQQSPSTTPSPHIRSGSVSPQVSTSPLPNGIVPSPSEKDVILSHHHRLPVFQTKGHAQKLCHSQPQQQPVQQYQVTASAPNFQFPSSQVLTAAPATPATTTPSQQVCASQVFATQLKQLQVKNSNLHHKGGVNKLTMPISMTIPIATQASLGGMALGGQHQTHALFITSEEAQKQGIHLQQSTDQQQQNSPSSSMIS